MSTHKNTPDSLAPETLETALAAAGKKTVLYRSPDGSRVLLLPYGARVLGLFAPQGGDNFFWVHPALGEPASARELFAAEGWQNTGGDRTWLSPEIDIFFPDYPLCQRHAEPTTLDAAPYAVKSQDGGTTLRPHDDAALRPRRAPGEAAIEQMGRPGGQSVAP